MSESRELLSESSLLIEHVSAATEVLKTWWSGSVQASPRYIQLLLVFPPGGSFREEPTEAELTADLGSLSDLSGPSGLLIKNPGKTITNQSKHIKIIGLVPKNQ